ncbi:MAG: 3-hydroxyacyl-CoA dehydrogenase [Sinobacteraceae bacterium]|nr:3-hydroxyacyl-CoA dehydrogenase [Nevskiaceae bacterium]
MIQQGIAIGVVGAGTMGRGIAQLFAEAGHEVRLYDVQDGAAVRARDFVADLLRRAADKGRITPEQAQAVLERIQLQTTLDGLAGCDVVIEAVIEDLGVKRELFRTLEPIVGDQAILASNTSSLLVAEIAAACRRPQRVAGLHFFNPVPLMKVVEVIPAVRTAPETVATLRQLVQGTGHRAVVAADQPGFLVNHAGRGLYTEGLRVIEEQAATPAQVDILIREAAGFRMGPFELLDLTGLDVSGKVMESIYEQFQHEPRFRPSSLVRPRIAAGLYGRKSGEGWYRYQGQQRIEPERQPPPPLPDGLKVWISRDAEQHAGIATLAHKAGAQVVSEMSQADLLVLQPWGRDATSCCVAQGVDATRAVALDPLPGLDRHRTVMLSAVTTPGARDAALALFSSDGVPATLIGDSPGFVVQRILVTIVNIAANIAQRGIATVADLEDAVKLGLGYPQGPLTMGDAIGPMRVLTILRNMHACTGDPRYRPSPWLQRRATLGVSLLTPEAPRT